MKDLALLVMGAVLGVLATNAHELASQWWGMLMRNRRLARRVDSDKPQEFSKHAIRYMERIGRRSDLYTTQTFRDEIRLPIVRENGPQIDPKVTSSAQECVWLEHPSEPRREFPVNRKALRAARLSGARIFDGTVLFVATRSIRDGMVSFGLSRCNYFSYTSRIYYLHRLIRSRYPNHFRHRQILDRLSASSHASHPPQIAGCSSVTVFREDGKTDILLSRRSSSVAHSSGLICSLPSFGLESNIASGENSKYGLLYYNYLREFGEEIFNLEELIELTESKHFGPDWIFSLPHMPDLVHEVQSGEFSLLCLGVSANTYDGAIDLALLAEFRSGEFLAKIRQAIWANWESESNVDGPSIELIDLFDIKIDDWVRDQQIDNCSIVAIDLARAYYRRLGLSSH